MQRDDLPAFDQLRIGRIMRLHIEQVPAFAKNFIHRNNSRRFFVLRQEVRTACQETAGVVPRLPRCAGFIPALEIHSQRELDLPVGAKTHTLFDSGRHGSENRTTRKR